MTFEKGYTTVAFPVKQNSEAYALSRFHKLDAKTIYVSLQNYEPGISFISFYI